MKEKLLQQGANFWIIVGTLIFLILSCFIYLNYYIPNKENRLITTRFRVLDQIGENVNSKVESYFNNALSLQWKIQHETERIREQFDTTLLGYTNEDIANYLFDELAEGRRNFQKILNEDLRLIYYKLDNKKQGTLNNPKYCEDFELNPAELENYFTFTPFNIRTEGVVAEEPLVYNDSVEVGVKYEDILYGLTRDDVFDQLFVVRKEKVVFSTLKADLLIELLDGDQGYQSSTASDPITTAQDPFRLMDDSNTRVSTPARVISGECADITISNEKYKLFFKPVIVRGENWFIGGLLNTQNFRNESRSIEQWVIIMLSLILILIILGLPLIKLKVISRIEHLKTGSIIHSAVVILLGILFITYFLFYLSQSIVNQQNTDDRLEDLSSEIDTAFTGEIESAYHQLTKYDNLFWNLVSLDEKEYGAVPYIEDIYNPKTSNLTYPEIYPFGEYIFWIKKNGQRAFYLSPFKGTTGELLDLGHRDYFKNVDEWFLPLDSTKKFRLESIFSVLSGNHKVAISTKSKRTASPYPVVALTSQFYSLIDPVIPMNYGYCIIDEQGKVWFHSNKERNLMENFVSECNGDKNLKAAIYNRTSVPININYYNKPHRAYIKPLKQLPLYLITFYDRDHESSFQAQVFTIALIFSGLFLLLIFLQVSAILILDRIFKWKIAKNLIMNISRPRLHLASHYRFLIRVYLLILIFTAFVLSYIGTFHSFVAIFLVEVITFAFSYKVLNDNDLKSNQVKWFNQINLFILVLLNVWLFRWGIYGDSVIVLVYELLLILFLYLAYRSFKLKLNERRVVLNKAFIRHYVILLLFISVIFSMLPAMVFYEIAYNIESEIRLRHYQADLMKKKEMRNTRWNNYFETMMDLSTSSKILQERKNRGIYSKFLHDLDFSNKALPTIDNKKEADQLTGFGRFITFLRPFYDEKVEENKYLLLENQSNGQKIWQESRGDSLILTYESISEDSAFSKPNTLWLTGVLNKINFLLPNQRITATGVKAFAMNAVFWLFILFILYIFYFLIRFGVRNIYSLDIFKRYHKESFNKIFRQHALARKNLFLIKQSPFDKTPAFLGSNQFNIALDWSKKEIIEQSEIRVKEYLDNKEPGQKNTPETSSSTINSLLELNDDVISIFIDHFEWGYSDPLIMKEKLHILFLLLNQDAYRIIIQSTVSLDSIIRYYKGVNGLGINTKGKARDNEKTEETQWDNIIKTLKVVRDNQVVIYLPVKCSSVEQDKESRCNKERKKLDMEGLIENELNASDYLLRFRKTMMDFSHEIINAGTKDNPEEIILQKINFLAESYYNDLYNSCSAEEKYVMFDIAEDLIMNQKNSDIIYQLLDKGILIRKCDRISFMNVSFQRFIVSKGSKIITKEIEAIIGKQSSSWQGYRVVFMLVIVSLFIFIAIANQDLMKNINQIFVMVGGVIASITAILGLLSRKGKSASE